MPSALTLQVEAAYDRCSASEEVFVLTSVVGESGLAAMVDWLARAGYAVFGPTVRDGVIVLDEIDDVADLPFGWGDEQHPGAYELVERGDGFAFNHAVGADSWKRFLNPPHTDLLHVRRVDGSLVFEEVEPAPPRHAFIGVRACDLAAIAVQDRVFLGRVSVDATYARRRSSSFIVAVNCSTPSESCFCASMGTGPECSGGFDVALTELGTGKDAFLFEAGSARGEQLVAALRGRSVTDADLEEKDAIIERATSAQVRTMPDVAQRRRLSASHASPQWEEIAQRCLSCANCTMVCPTCFCSSVEDAASLDGEVATRRRRWDSCFGLDFSSVHGTPVRSSTASRYRQWLTHKLDTWHDQFGISGCVGCGRCITWCPVGIDLTRELAAIVEERSES